MESNAPIGDWGLASQAHELEVGFLGNRRGFADDTSAAKATHRRKGTERKPAVPIVA